MSGPGGAPGSIFWPAPVCNLLLGARMGPGKNASRGALAVSSPDLSSCSQMFVPGTFLYVGRQFSSTFISGSQTTSS